MYNRPPEFYDKCIGFADLATTREVARRGVGAVIPDYAGLPDDAVRFCIRDIWQLSRNALWPSSTAQHHTAMPYHVPQHTACLHTVPECT